MPDRGTFIQIPASHTNAFEQLKQQLNFPDQDFDQAKDNYIKLNQMLLETLIQNPQTDKYVEVEETEHEDTDN
jgi:hypothetical protein